MIPVRPVQLSAGPGAAAGGVAALHFLQHVRASGRLALQDLGALLLGPLLGLNLGFELLNGAIYPALCSGALPAYF